MNILFVCTGNTCRSPIAEGFMKHKIEHELGDASSDFVFSRGLSVAQGSSVSANSVLAAGESGADIGQHVPAQLTAGDIALADYVFTMTSSQARMLKDYFTEYFAKIFSVSEFVSGEDISDPYGGSPDVYRHCAKQIFDAVEIIFNKLFKDKQ